MPVTIVLGAQWGDEGKAKVVDYLTRDADIVARFQGGANAGHTVQVEDTQFVFHVIPSGIMHPGKICVVGNGVVLDPEAAIAEIEELAVKGISVEGRLYISQNAHVVMPYHKLFDRLGEEQQGSGKLGTTGRGIGPAYRDKVERTWGIRVMDLLNEKLLRERIPAIVAEKNRILTRLYEHAPLDAADITTAAVDYGSRLRGYVTDTACLLNDALTEGKNVLLEGAQGTLLDIDHGTYPFVTSSNTTAGGACTGTGIGPTRIGSVIGVTKAYTTRVGNGPFPTELSDTTGERIRELGHEYGATTGRPRRCGWFDAVIVRLAARVNGLTRLALTRLDVLDTVETLKVCVAYRRGDDVLEEFPGDPQVLSECLPVYEEWAGWCTSTRHVRRYADLPVQARNYVDRLSALTRTPVQLISVGPERDATILME